MLRRLILCLLPLLAACTATPATLPAPSAAAVEMAASKASRLIGTAAPLFTLSDQDGKAVSLASFKGQWVVLYFYGKEDTPGCSCMANEYTDLLLNLVNVPAKVLGINDQPPEDALYSSDRYGILITVLADPDAKVMPRYGVRTGEQDLITRGTFLIAPDGRIAWHWPVVVAEGHVERIKQKLKDLGAPVAATGPVR